MVKNYYERTDLPSCPCVERKKKRGARVLRDDSTCLARLSPRDPRILQNHGGQLCKRLFGASVPAGSTGLNRNRVVQPTPSDRKLVRFRIEMVPETRSPASRLTGQFEY